MLTEKVKKRLRYNGKGEEVFFLYKPKLEKDIRCPLEYGLDIFGGKCHDSVPEVRPPREIIWTGKIQRLSVYRGNAGGEQKRGVLSEAWFCGHAGRCRDADL